MVVPSNPFFILVPPQFQTPPMVWGRASIDSYIDMSARNAMIDFVMAYRQDPSQYGNAKPIELIGEWRQLHEWILIVATFEQSVELYQFVLDTGVNISNSCFFRDFYDTWRIEQSPPIFSLIMTHFADRVARIPVQILFGILCGLNIDPDYTMCVTLFEKCPQLNDPNLINSLILAPISTQDLSSQTLFYLEGGEHYWTAENVATIGSVPPITKIFDNRQSNLFRLFIEHSMVDSTPLYQELGINRPQPPPKSLQSLELLPSLESKPEPEASPFLQITTTTTTTTHPPHNHITCQISGPLSLSSPCLDLIKNFLSFTLSFCPSPDTVRWHISYWENVAIANSITIFNYKNLLSEILLTEFETRSYWENIIIILDYLGSQFFSTFSLQGIVSFLTDLRSTLDMYDPFQLSNILVTVLQKLVSFPSLIDKMQDNCRWLICKFALPFMLSDCTDLFLDIGGLTMEDIWSPLANPPPNNETALIHQNDNANPGNDVTMINEFENHTINNLFFNQIPLGTLSRPYKRERLVDFLNWISFQPGTKQQLTHMVTSGIHLRPNSPIEYAPHEQIASTILFGISTPTLIRTVAPSPLPTSLLPHYQQDPLLSPQQQRKQQQVQSPSWIQTILAYGQIDLFNLQFTLDSLRKLIFPFRIPSPTSEQIKPIELHPLWIKPYPLNPKPLTIVGLPHIPIIIAPDLDYGQVVLEDLIEGVINLILELSP